MMLGLAIIGMASQQQGISYDCQHILFKQWVSDENDFHAQLQLDSASVQAKQIYIILRHLQYSGITVPGVKIPQIYYIIAITVK